MAERPRDSVRVEDALAELGPSIEFPPTPDLVARVGSRLASDGRRRPVSLVGRPRRLAFALAAAAVLVVGLLAFGLGGPARTAIAERLGLRGITIALVPAVPTPTPVPSPTPRARPGESLGLGVPTTLEALRARVGFAVLQPNRPDLGEPDAVYVTEPPVGGQVALVYGNRPGLPPTADPSVGLILTQFRGQIEPNFFGKGLGPGTRLEEVTVNGGRGYWIDGAPHMFFYRDASGGIQTETIRLVGNTLLWEQAGLTLRIESSLGRDEALAIAETVR